MSAAVIRPVRPADADGLRSMILAIQREEFGFDVTLDDQPDLLDEGLFGDDGFYARGHGGCWVAADEDGRVVGSIALHDCGDGLGALRKMFVATSHRGAGPGGTPVALALLHGLLDHARAAGFRQILLGTTERFAAAHRFYDKHGFARVDEADLPARFPRMALDTRFYGLVLS